MLSAMHDKFDVTDILNRIDIGTNFVFFLKSMEKMSGKFRKEDINVNKSYRFVTTN